MTSARRALVPIWIAAAFAVLALLLGATVASASTDQRSIFEDDVSLTNAPVLTLHTLRQLGAGTVRVGMHWSVAAPDPRPGGFDASDPGAYGHGFDQYDAIIRAAQAAGIEVDLVVAGGAPSWATSPDIPDSSYNFGQWKPSASEYGLFFQAVARRYSGGYRPPGNATPLPRVRMWEIWNEENWGQDLAPQADFGSTFYVSPGIYRPMLDAGWSALQGTGHGHDTILVGSLSPRGQDQPGPFHTTKPLRFLRGLYCVDSNYHPLLGAAATQLGCPSSGQGFRFAHPALFAASGLNDHPYPFNLPPTRADSADPNYAEFSQLPRLNATVNRLLGANGSRARVPLYNTEYAYETNPPNNSAAHFVSPQTAASFINWAEYLSYKRPWLQSYMQYQLFDPPPTQGESLFGYGGFASGLVFNSGNRPKPGYAAYRLPIFLPVTSTRRKRSLEVWGCVRPAHFAQLDTGRPQSVRIQLNGRTVKTVRIRNPRCYFDVRVKFRRSGSVRLAWSYPRHDAGLSGGYPNPVTPGQTIYSRSVRIRVR